MEENATKKTSIKEVFIVALVIIIAVVTLSAKFYFGNKIGRENALISELGSIRGAVRLYMAVNKTYPPDIKSLVMQKHNLFGKEEPYLTGVTVDKDNNPVDSWGHKFQYDAKRGWVSSGSRRYSKW